MIQFCAVLMGLLIRRVIGWAGTLPAPVLTKTPDYPVYITGEAVTLDCTVDNRPYQNYFTFFKHNANHLSQSSPTYQMYTREQMSGDKYTCQYTAGSVTSPMSNSITLHVLDPPLAPKISLRTSLNSEPGERWYIPDEYVTVICTSPKLNMNGVRYYINGKVTHTANVNRRETAYQMLVSGRELSVRCMYWRIEHGRQIDSLMSDPVTLKIADPPPSPSISLRPSRLEYTRDESIDVICIPPQSYPVRGIRYYKETSEIYSINMPQIQTSFPVPRNAAGDYTCGYWIESGGNKILSFSSDIVTVRRTDHPPSPSISLRPLRLEYTRDESIDVICTPPQSYPVRGIRYYKDTSEIYSINLSQIQTSYPVPRNASGDYTCGYWIESGGNEILSYSSAIVTVRRTGFTTPLSSVLITRVMEAHTSKGRYSLNVYYCK
uniref:Ig-like domain-containing protein n=1 Tax=Xenopus tropicalis TaxID=8364 RepID=A0A803KGA2_XENTR